MEQSVLEMIIDQTTVSASITSIISDRPKVYRTVDGKIGVAVYGVLMPYRVYMMCLVAQLHCVEAMTGSLKNGNVDPLEEEMKSMYRGVDVPGRFRKDFNFAPWLAAEKAMKLMFENIRKSENAKEDIIAMIREVEEEYANLYEAPLEQTIIVNPSPAICSVIR